MASALNGNGSTRQWRRIRDEYARHLEAGGTAICPYCHLPVQPGDQWHLDHAIPRASGGNDTVANLRIAHARCNEQNRPTVLPPSRDW